MQLCALRVEYNNKKKNIATKSAADGQLAITTDSHHYTDAEPTVSSCDRPFKLLVKDQTFLIDSASLSKVSPVFAAMLFGKDFENGRELAREIVDEKSNDISTFLMCLGDAHCINDSRRFRLENHEVWDANAFNVYRARNHRELWAVSIILAAKAAKEPVQGRIVDKYMSTYPKTMQIMLTDILIQLYGAVIGANLSLSQARCKHVLCEMHWKTNKCSSDYGTRMLSELRTNIVDLEWE
uniref:BTB domain-containing protein n=1 Tax=Parascaris equorum TaxID=6256 RepID=A0A914S1E8_PAREQ